MISQGPPSLPPLGPSTGLHISCWYLLLPPGAPLNDSHGEDHVGKDAEAVVGAGELPVRGSRDRCPVCLNPSPSPEGPKGSRH